MTRVVCAGNLVVDINARPVESMAPFGVVDFVDHIDVRLGGNAANVASALAALEIPVTLIARIGSDALGHLARERLRHPFIDTGCLLTDETLPTSTTVAIINSKGARAGLHHFGASAGLSEADFNWDELESERQSGQPRPIFHLCAFFLMPRLEGAAAAGVLQHARQCGYVTSLDVSWDGSSRWLAVLEPLLPHVDIFLPNLEEAHAITGCANESDAAEFFADRGIPIVVIKMGAAGCFLRSGELRQMVPARSVAVVDSTGAGDCFIAGFLAATLWDWSLEQRARLGHAVAALHISGEKLLSRGQILECLRQNH